MVAIMLALQSVSGPVLPVERSASQGRCPPVISPDEVVVCGRRDDDQFRLKPLPPGYQQPEGLPKAQTALLGGKAAVETEQAMIGTAPVNRIMVRWKLPF